MKKNYAAAKCPASASSRSITVTQPTTKRQRLLLAVVSLGPIGYLPASGTVAVAIVGVPMFYLLDAWPAAAYVTFTLAFTAGAIAPPGWGDRVLGTKDSRVLVWDEIAGFLVAVAFVPFTWRLAFIAFFVQRCLDIVKVPPAPWIEKRWPGGWGVVGDDLVAGIYTCALLHLLIHYAPGVAGVTA